MRKILEKGTIIRVPGGVLYEITGEPIGEGGGSIIYPVCRYLPDGNSYSQSRIMYALKECYPLTLKYKFSRDAAGEIRPEQEDEEAAQYLSRVKQMHFSENAISGEIYNKGFRLTPALEFFQNIEISQDGGDTFQKAANSISIMESLSKKGQSLKKCLQERKHLPADQTFRIIEQVLYAVREVHESGYLHLDIQDGNIFLKGTLEDASGMISLIDFGSSRKRMEDGLCQAVADRVLYATPGFSAPEILSGNDGTLRLGPQADIYSVGCLTLLLLTGHRFSAGELAANKTGRYIPRFSLRKTKCPAHLTQRMQSILARALRQRPEDRYADTQEMLEDVTDFLALLAPYRNPLSAMEYDAFICYRHGPLDGPAAKELRNALERYRGGWLWGKKPIGRIFLDEGELASCADFGERIREALKNSGWLIVVCSRQTRESPWVNDEIQTFLEFHDPSRVLTVVTEGEPSEIFPEALLKHGMDENRLFAADARGENLRRTLRKIRGDVKLRIAAPILHTTYDALKQRAKIYAVKRASALSGALLLLLSAFLGYAAVKSREIAAQAVKLADEHEAALQSQALYLSEQARQSYEAHDPMTAMEQAVQASDLLKSQGGVLPDLVQTLTEAMGIYTLPANAQETVTAVGRFSLEEEGSFENYFLDSQGKYLFTADDSHVYIWNARTYDCQKTITSPWTIEAFDREFLLEEKNRYLLVLADEIICHDYEQDKDLWTRKFDSRASGIAVSADQSRIAAVTQGKIHILDAEDGQELLWENLPEGGSGTAPVLSPDKKWAAYVRAGEANGKYLLKTVLCDTESGRFTDVQTFESEQSLDFTACHLYFTKDNKLCMLFGSGLNTVYTGDVYKYYSEKKTLEVSMYDPVQKRVFWKVGRDYMTLDDRIIVLEDKCKGRPAIFLIYGKDCQAFDRETGETLDACETDAPIIQAWREEGRIALALENGDLLYREQEEGRLIGYEYFPEKIVGCEKGGEDYYIRKRKEATFGGEPAVIRYQEGLCDPGYEPCEEESLPDAKSQSSANETEADSPDGRYRASIQQTSVTVRDKKTQKDKILETKDAPLSLQWLSDSRRLLIGFSDRASLYDIRGETTLDSGKLEHATFSAASWHILDESTALYQGDVYSYALDVGEDSFGVLYGMKDFLGYDPKEEVFYYKSESYDMDRLNEGLFPEETQMGKIRRYGTEEIIDLARGRIK